MLRRSLLFGMSVIMQLNHRSGLPELSLNQFTLLLALFFTLVINVPLNLKLLELISTDPSLDLGFILSIPVFFTVVFFLIFWFFTLPLFIKPVSIILVLVSTLVSYSMYSFGIVFDYSMIQNIFETNFGEASAYWNPSLLLWISLMGGVPAFLIYRAPIRRDNPIKSLVHKLLGLVIALVVFGLVAAFYSADYAAFGRTHSSLKRSIIPTQYLWSTYRYLDRNFITPPPDYRQIGTDAALVSDQEKPELMILVLGETARAQNFQWNGYARDTNRFTQEHDLIAVQNVSSCGTATAVSVPCMFSRLAQSEFDGRVADYQDNLIDIFTHAGVDVYWLENDGGCKGVCKRVPTEAYGSHLTSPHCTKEFCDDLILLEGLDNTLQKLSDQSALIVLHTNGSHGPTYYERYAEDFRAFTPDCPRSDIQNCSAEALRNTYDNTLLHTDYLISEVITRLKNLSTDWDARLIYISDHGESLGEYGFYLHGMPYALAPPEQTQIPWLFWLSDTTLEGQHLNSACLKQQAQQGQYSHDYFFDSMLGLMQIETSEYRPELDIFAPCRAS